MNCPMCGEKMVRIMCGVDLVCQNDDCGHKPEWCCECDNAKENCFCDLYEKEED